MAKGDRIDVTVDMGGGVAFTHKLEADGAGRTIDFARDKREGLITVEVMGRAGSTIRKYEFKADRVISVVEVKK